MTRERQTLGGRPFEIFQRPSPESITAAPETALAYVREAIAAQQNLMAFHETQMGVRIGKILIKENQRQVGLLTDTLSSAEQGSWHDVKTFLIRQSIGTAVQAGAQAGSDEATKLIQKANALAVLAASLPNN